MARIIVVIGASKGIGRATASLFYHQGNQLVVAARSKDALEQFEREHPGSRIFVGDLTEPATLEKLCSDVIAEFGRIDVLVVSAAPFLSKPLADVSDDEWATSSRYINLIFYANRAAARQMGSQENGGVVVNISSRAGIREDVLPGSSVYGFIKGGMTHLVMAANQESEKVQFISLCPGLVSDTEMGQRAIQERPGLNNGAGMTALEVAEAISALVEGANDRSPHVYRLTKENGLEVIERPVTSE